MTRFLAILAGLQAGKADAGADTPEPPAERTDDGGRLPIRQKWQLAAVAAAGWAVAGALLGLAVHLMEWVEWGRMVLRSVSGFEFATGGGLCAIVVGAIGGGTTGSVVRYLERRAVSRDRRPLRLDRKLFLCLVWVVAGCALLALAGGTVALGWLVCVVRPAGTTGLLLACVSAVVWIVACGWLLQAAVAVEVVGAPRPNLRPILVWTLVVEAGGVLAGVGASRLGYPALVLGTALAGGAGGCYTGFMTRALARRPAARHLAANTLGWALAWATCSTLGWMLGWELAVALWRPFSAEVAFACGMVLGGAVALGAAGGLGVLITLDTLQWPGEAADRPPPRQGRVQGVVPSAEGGKPH